MLIQSVRRVLAQGSRTADIAAFGETVVSSAAITDAILAGLNDISAGSRKVMQS
jgi:hypothetical protein